MNTAVLHQSPIANDPTLCVRLVRSFGVSSNGAPMTLAPAAQRLVSYLALHDGPVPRPQVSGSLWADVDDHHASASLRSALWRLAPTNLVGSTSSHLWLRPEVEVDLRRLIRLALVVLREDPAPEQLVSLAREFVDIGDELLAGWYEEWIEIEREQFRQLRLQALDRIGEALAEIGRTREALLVGLAVVRVEPLRETAHRLVIAMHLRQGNRAEALRHFRGYARLLDDELGVAPSPLMQLLMTPLLGPRPSR